MLRALDDLERAVSQLVKNARGNAPGVDPLKTMEASVGQTIKGGAINRPDQINEEAAELIRRAIKRLKSL
ncbi:MAG: hypothetical protein RRA15_02495 [bacterium]|nr:hypothetical protein [bacterium]MDT8365345.1 hypothetical protein [bacterium]